MGKIYEALNKAEKEFQKSSGEKRFDPAEKYLPATTVTTGMQIPVSRVADLKSKLLTRYAGDAVKTILVTGTASGSGASTTSIDLATDLTKDLIKVLLMDANFRTPGCTKSSKPNVRAGCMM